MLSNFYLNFYTAWRWSVCLKFVRNWRERFGKDNVQGVSITDEKIRYFLDRRHGFPGQILKNLFWSHPRKRQKVALSRVSIGVGNALLHAGMSRAGIKPVKPARKYVITLIEVPKSREAAEKCITSAKQYGENQNLEVFPAIDQSSAKSFFTEHQLSWIGRNKSEIRQATMGCFASHFSLWMKCIELGESIIILEHDVTFVSRVPTLKFRHVANLSYNAIWKPHINFWARNNQENYYPFTYMRGLGAYAITPEAAALLVEAARRGVVFAADNFIRRDVVSIVDYRPACFHHATDFSTLRP